MSGFAALNGEPDGAPLLPPLALADGVAGLATAFADPGRAARARGDGPRPGRRHVAGRAAARAARPAAGGVRPARQAAARTGNRSSHNAPRNVYRTADGSWVAVSASADVGRRARARARRAGRSAPSSGGSRPERGASSTSTRSTGACRAWIAERDRDEVSPRSRQPRRRSHRSTTRATSSPTPSWPRSARSADVDGSIKMPGVIGRLSETPGTVRRAAARTAPTRRLYSPSSGWKPAELERLRGGGRVRTSAADLALRPGRPPRPGRKGDRLPGACRDRRPRGRRRARREGGGARRTGGAARRAADKPVYVRVNAGDAEDLEGGHRPGAQRRPRTEGRPPEDVPNVDLPVHCLIESAAGVEAAFEIASTRGCRDLARRVRSPLPDGRARGGARLGAQPDRQRGRRRRPAAAAAVGLSRRARRGGSGPLVRPWP